MTVIGVVAAAGTPVRVLSRSLRAEAGLPALAATVGAGAAGVLTGLGQFVLIQDGNEGAPVVLGPWVAALAASVCARALNRVRADRSPTSERPVSAWRVAVRRSGPG